MIVKVVIRQPLGTGKTYMLIHDEFKSIFYQAEASEEIIEAVGERGLAYFESEIIEDSENPGKGILYLANKIENINF